MEVFKKEDKMCKLIVSEVNLLPVISRFNIKLGFKEQSIDEVCNNYKVNTNFFLAIANTYIYHNYFPEKELLSFSPILLINYLKETHSYYINYALPKIELLLNNVLKSCSKSNENLIIIESFYKKYKAEILLHFEAEEKNVFPYIISLLEQKKQKGVKRIADYGQEHTDIETKLSDLKNLIIKYLSPDYGVNEMNEFLHTLYHFEQDLNDHARIEDCILIKQVKKIESSINNA